VHSPFSNLSPAILMWCEGGGGVVEVVGERDGSGIEGEGCR
jgi:hypothetical protein